MKIQTTLTAAALCVVLVAPHAGCEQMQETGGQRHVEVVDGPEAFDQLLATADGPVLVDFFATWCAPCKMLAPTIVDLAIEYDGRAEVVKVDVDKTPSLARRYEVQGVPTVIFFVDGQPVERMVGLSEPGLYRRAMNQAIAKAGHGAQTQPDNAQENSTPRKEATMPERTDLVTMKGDPVTLVGPEVAVGDPAPDFVAVNTDLEDVRLSQMDSGKVTILSAVPSLDTSVCSTQTKKFNDAAGEMSDQVRIVTISMDLPFAQKRWCGAEAADNITVLSDHREADFGENYGVLIKDLRLLARSVFVVDTDGTIRYAQIVSEVTDEPDYDAALAAAKALVE